MLHKAKRFCKNKEYCMAKMNISAENGFAAGKAVFYIIDKEDTENKEMRYIFVSILTEKREKCLCKTKKKRFINKLFINWC